MVLSLKLCKGAFEHELVEFFVILIYFFEFDMNQEKLYICNDHEFHLVEELMAILLIGNKSLAQKNFRSISAIVLT